MAEAGVPLARAIVILDTLHPIHEGRAFRWRSDTPEVAEAVDYGRTNEGAAAENWRNSPFFHLLESGETAMRRCLAAGDPADFPTIAQARDEGATDANYGYLWWLNTGRALYPGASHESYYARARRRYFDLDRSGERHRRGIALTDPAAMDGFMKLTTGAVAS